MYGLEIRTVADIHPEKVFLTKEEVKTLKLFKNKPKGESVYIENSDISNTLIMKGLISYSNNKLKLRT